MGGQCTEAEEDHSGNVSATMRALIRKGLEKREN